MSINARSILLFFTLLGSPLEYAMAEGVYWNFMAYEKFQKVISSQNPVIYTEDKSPKYVLTRFVVEGKSADAWTEAFEVFNTRRKDEPKSPKEWYLRFRQQGEASCPGGEWLVIGDDSSSFTFERQTPACPPHEQQHALYRVIYGKKQVFTLIATKKGTMDDAARNGWLGVLQSASIR